MHWFNTKHKHKHNDTKDSTASFIHSRTRENIKSGEKHSTIFGKIARYLQDLKLVAFTGSYDDLNGKPTAMAPSAHKHTKADITDFPLSMPASDVKAWAKAATKPSYSWSEITNKPNDLPLNCIYSTSWHDITEAALNFNTSFKPYVKFDKDYVYIGCYQKNNNSNTTDEKNYFAFKTGLNPHTSYTAFYSLHKALLGTSSCKWHEIYCTNSTITTSDKNQKKDISYIGQDSGYDNTRMDDDTLVKLILGLKPVIYTRIDADSNRPHHGIVSQDFEELLKKLGIKDHAAFIKSPKTKAIEIEEEVEKEAEEEVTNEDGTKQIVKRTVKEIQTRIEYEEIPGEYTYGMRYEELFGDNVRFSQILWYKIMEQEKIIQEQQEEINGLKARFEILEAKVK